MTVCILNACNTFTHIHTHTHPDTHTHPAIPALGAALTPGEICSRASRLLTFIDMGGHARSLKTCLWGMTCLLPDYTVLCVCAVGGLGRMSREHLAVAVALESESTRGGVALSMCCLTGAGAGGCCMRHKL